MFQHWPAAVDLANVFEFTFAVNPKIANATAKPLPEHFQKNSFDGEERFQILCQAGKRALASTFL
jgi:hypothetical protein